MKDSIVCLVLSLGEDLPPIWPSRRILWPNCQMASWPLGWRKCSGPERQWDSESPGESEKTEQKDHVTESQGGMCKLLDCLPRPLLPGPARPSSRQN